MTIKPRVCNMYPRGGYMRPKKRSHRVHITIPPELLDMIEYYQINNAIQNRTTAIMELVRKGLKAEE